jgi:C4-dicarboxylate transporter, DctM subunit
VIPFAFIIVLVVLVLVLSLSGAGPTVGLTELAVLGLVFLAFFISGIYVAAALGLLALIADLTLSPNRPINPFFGEIAWGSTTNFTFVAIPLFLLMGEILLRAGLSERLYRTLYLWIAWLPGDLLHVNIASSAVFSAISGSSTATAATIGSVAIPHFQGSHHGPRIVLGSLAAGGALGNLIPPGIAFIVYSLFTETSVASLYAAGLAAGLLVALAFMAYIFVANVGRERPIAFRASWGERLRSLPDLIPVLVLILLVVGSIYLGFATATEGAALGVVGALVLAALYGQLDWRMMTSSVKGASRTTGIVGIILLFAFVLNFVLSSVQLPQLISGTIASLPLPNWGILLVVILLYLALGVFMDGLAMVVTTLPVIFPVMVALGYDPIWFGVVVVMLIEMAVISPPDGMVLYILQGVRTPKGPIMDVFVGVLPFLGVYVLVLILIILFPGLVLWIQPT